MSPSGSHMKFDSCKMWHASLNLISQSHLHLNNQYIYNFFPLSINEKEFNMLFDKGERDFCNSFVNCVILFISLYYGAKSV